jgi:hypothetical protein
MAARSSAAYPLQQSISKPSTQASSRARAAGRRTAQREDARGCGSEPRLLTVFFPLSSLPSNPFCAMEPARLPFNGPGHFPGVTSLLSEIDSLFLASCSPGNPFAHHDDVVCIYLPLLQKSCCASCETAESSSAFYGPSINSVRTNCQLFCLGKRKPRTKKVWCRDCYSRHAKKEGKRRTDNPCCKGVLFVIILFFLLRFSKRMSLCPRVFVFLSLILLSFLSFYFPIPRLLLISPFF